MSEPRISVALATYNGAEHLAEQLDSLASQRHLPFELVVCDDGSQDATLKILDDFASTAPFPVRIHRNEENLGYADNFLKAAGLCSGDWVAFCDQDDVWLPNKLADAAHTIRDDPESVLILQNAYICNESLEKGGRQFPKRIRRGTYASLQQYGFWVWLGCLQTIRRDLFDLPKHERLPNYYPGHEFQSHDKWTCMIANALGGVVVLAAPAACYRRHERALTGDYRSQSAREKINKSLRVGADHYRFLAGVAEASAQSMAKLASESKVNWRSRFMASARGFERLAQIQHERAELYDSASSARRIACFMAIVARGGYIGPSFVAMGWKSAMKDLWFLLVRGYRQGREPPAPPA